MWQPHPPSCSLLYFCLAEPWGGSLVQWGDGGSGPSVGSVSWFPSSSLKLGQNSWFQVTETQFRLMCMKRDYIGTPNRNTPGLMCSKQSSTQQVKQGDQTLLFCFFYQLCSSHHCHILTRALPTLWPWQLQAYVPPAGISRWKGGLSSQQSCIGWFEPCCCRLVCQPRHTGRSLHWRAMICSIQSSRPEGQWVPMENRCWNKKEKLMLGRQNLPLWYNRAFTAPLWRGSSVRTHTKKPHVIIYCLLRHSDLWPFW